MTLTEYRTMRYSATESAALRGHEIQWQPSWKEKNRTGQTGVCRKCGMECRINSNPRPNEINISGEAIALNCN